MLLHVYFEFFFGLIKFIVIERQYDEITESCEVSDLLVSKRKNICSDIRMHNENSVLYTFYEILIIYYF